MYLGGRLKDYRKSLGITAEELAEIAGVTQSTLSKYENDKLPIPVEVVVNITKANKDVKLLTRWLSAQNEWITKQLIS